MLVTRSNRKCSISGDGIAVIGTVFSTPHHDPAAGIRRLVGARPRAGRLYVAGAQTVYVISTASDTIIATVAMPSTIGADCIARAPQSRDAHQ
jgi:hypothetical protein